MHREEKLLEQLSTHICHQVAIKKYNSDYDGKTYCKRAKKPITLITIDNLRIS